MMRSNLLLLDIISIMSRVKKQQQIREILSAKRIQFRHQLQFDINHLILLEHNTNSSLSHAFCGDRFQLFLIEEILLFAKILNACMYIIPFKYCSQM